MRQAWLGAGCLLALSLSLDAGAQEVAQQSRAPLGEAIREVLIATPELLAGIGGTSPAPVDLYAEDTARDIDLLARAAPRLFDPRHPSLGPEGAPIRIAVFTRDDCQTCAGAMADLRALAERMGFRATVFDIERDAGLARHLGLDMAPSYVMRDRMLRGAMPAIVLERYLSE